MVKRFFAIAVIVIIIISLFAIPVSALDNTIGRVVEECPFLGISYANSGYKPYIFAFDDVVTKVSVGSDWSLSAGSYLWLYYDLPQSDSLSVTFSPTISLASDFKLSKVYWYGWNQTEGTDYGTRTYLKAGSVDSYVFYNGYSSFNITPASFDMSGYDKLIIALVTSDACIIDRVYGEEVWLSDVDVSGSVAASSGSVLTAEGYIYNNELTMSPIDFTTKATTFDASLIGTGSVVSLDDSDVMAASTMMATYGDDGGLVETVNSISADVSGLGSSITSTIVSESSDIQSSISNQTTSINSKLDTESTEIQNKLNTESNEIQEDIWRSQEEQTASINTKLDTESDEIQQDIWRSQEEQTASINTKLDTESSEIQTGIVNQTTSINDKLQQESTEIQQDIWDVGTAINNKLNTESNELQEDIVREADEIQNDIVVQTNKLSDQLQVIVDDYEAKTEQAGVIGSSSSESQIKNNQDTLSSGQELMSDLNDEAVTGFDNMSSGATGMFNLMAVALPPILTFGPHQSLLNAVLIILTLTFILFFERRLRHQ